ncbi:MAG: hypothetical protein AAB930_00870 [Patescibacteria group bacterium]
MKNDYPIHVIRVGIAITFLWIGVLIFKSPELWGSILQPWAAGLLPVGLKEAMIGTAIFDFAIGFFLLIDKYILPTSLLGFLHLLMVVAVVGITAGTARDIGLAAGLLALAIHHWPQKKSGQF